MVNLDEAFPFGASQQRSMAKRANGNFSYLENQMQTRTQKSPFTVDGLLSCDNKRQPRPKPRSVPFPGMVTIAETSSNELLRYAH